MTKKINIIGVGDDGQSGIFPDYIDIINDADLLIGGERHLNLFPSFLREKLVIKGNLAEISDRLEGENSESKVVILASGDPLFYGVATYFVNKLGKEKIEIYPHLSSIQLAFAKIGESWHDAFFESLHGRTIKGLAQRIDGKRKVAILTDTENSPSSIAKYLISFGFTEYKMYVAEDLGSSNEKISSWELTEVIEKTFSPLNVILLCSNSECDKKWKLGIEDDEFYQRKPEKGLITKKEVRVLSLAEMNLSSHHTVWDVGTGSGSISVGATKLAPFGKVYAIEKTDCNLENITNNMQKFRADFTIIHGSAPEALFDLPNPDVVFIGGSGGNLTEIIKYSSERLNANGRIVVNAVMLETLNETLTVFKKLGMNVKTTLVQVSRSKPILDCTRFDSLNPIYIITAEKFYKDNEKGDQ